MLDSDVRLINVAEDSTYDTRGERTPYIRVEFNVGKFGPFTERFDKATYSADVRDAKLNEFARHVRQPPGSA